MIAVTFKGKPETVYNHDNTVAYQRIKVPRLTRTHADMDAFRKSRAFGSYANSDLFPAMLTRAVKSAGISDYVRLDRLPDCVTVDAAGFLASVTITLPDKR